MVEPIETPRKPLTSQLARVLVLLMITVALVSAGLLALRGAGRPVPLHALPREQTVAVPDDPEKASAGLEKEISRLERDNRKLTRRVHSFHPRGLYLVIDIGSNHMYLMKDDKVLRDAIVSTGSGMRLADPAKPRSWVFDTPRGEMSILKKVVNPVWTKPDWAFVEVGEELPDSWRDRVERGVLGDYSLDMGDGYLIHGTLFERSLGLHVTHGCVRVGAEDLEAVFKSVGLGTRVYIL